MTVNASLTIQRYTEYGSENYNKSDTNSVYSKAWELGWTQESFACVLRDVEAKYGEDALLKILDVANIPPVFSSAV